MGRVLAVFFIPLACGVTGHGLGYIAKLRIDIRERQFLDQIKAWELTQDDIDAMDTNNDGEVSWSEFLEFMLIGMCKINYELLDDLQIIFHRLDVAGTGVLSRDDLVEMTRRKQKSPRRKLELAAYKRLLKERAAEVR
jgi:Ca2+-binding EF-hand superfamily protein